MSKLEKTLVVMNKKGLHARPAAMMVQLASKFQSQVSIVYEGQQVNGKSIMGILTLGAQNGASLNIIIEGPDAHEAMDAYTVFLSKQEEELTS